MFTENEPGESHLEAVPDCPAQTTKQGHMVDGICASPLQIVLTLLNLRAIY